MNKNRPAPAVRNNAVIYIRVSTQEQVENLSLDTQEERCRELCKRKAWPVVHVFREEGQSAKTTRRDQFQRMLRFSKEPKNAIGHIVVYDLSRFARNRLKFAGVFEPLVTQRVFDAVQDVLQGRKAVVKAYDKNNPEFPLRTFLRCGLCGDPITGGFSTSKNKNKYPYYRCRRPGCSLRNIRRDELEAEFVRLIKRLTPEPRLVDDLVDVVRNEWSRRQGDAEAACEVVHQRLARDRERKNNLIDLRLDGEIDERTYKEKNERLTAEIDAAELQLREAESGLLDLEDVLQFARKIITSPARLWLESSIDQRQKLQQTFFPNGLTFDGEAFGTPTSSLFFSLLGGISEDESRLASPTGFEPVLSP